MVDLTPEQIRKLTDRYGSMRRAAIAALKSGWFVEEFRSTNAILTKTGENFHPPAERHEALFWKLVWVSHLRGAKRGAKELGIPEDELWWIMQRRLENGDRASREWLAMETKRRLDLEYVPRTRLSPLVDWIDAHPERARHALSLREIPSEFRAGKLGSVPPGV